MSGGVLQLVSYGTQDVLLTGSPQITFWRQVWRRYGNFALESVLQTFHGTAGAGKRVSVTLSKNGDLAHKTYLEVELPAIPDISNVLFTQSNPRLPDYLQNRAPYQDDYMHWVDTVGFALIKSIDLEIGGTRIDRHTSEWLDAWSRLTVPSEKRAGFDAMVGRWATPEESSTRTGKVLYIPLTFFFNMFHGLALPLISIMYHEVRINIEFRSFKELLHPPEWVKANPDLESFEIPDDAYMPSIDVRMYVDMVYLDAPERKRFSKMPQELLVNTVQFLGDELVQPSQLTSVASATSSALYSGVSQVTTDLTVQRFVLNFVHPIKELIWIFVFEENILDNKIFEYEDVFEEVRLLLNGHLRFAPRRGSYFRLVQPWQHHTCVPDKPVYCYSFALHPEEAQPSGTMNFSRVDQANLIAIMKPSAKAKAGRVKVFGVAYNVLRIQNGLAGLAFSS